MNEDLQKRMEVQASVIEWIDFFMKQNNISASMMEDALSKALISIKDKAIKEFLTYVQVQAQAQVDPVSDIVEEVKDDEFNN